MAFRLSAASSMVSAFPVTDLVGLPGPIRAGFLRGAVEERQTTAKAAREGLASSRTVRHPEHGYFKSRTRSWTKPRKTPSDHFGRPCRVRARTDLEPDWRGARTRKGEGGCSWSEAELTGHQRKEAIARREAGEVLTDIARSYNVSHSTISRLN
jgi:hypothetical protein